MKPTISNAFTRNPRKSLASSLSPLRADLRETAFGWSMSLSPMQATDAVQAWLDSMPDTLPADTCYLAAAELTDWRNIGARAGLTDLVVRLGLGVHELVDEDQIVLGADALRQCVALCPARRWLVVQVEGPIELRDISAINKAMQSDLSPLDVEIRAQSALEIVDDRTVRVHTRRKEQAIPLVAENFRHYLAALRDRTISEFAPPQDWQLERLFGVSGAITVRPIETQMFSTSIDIGINTAVDGMSRPADRSLIYDIPSNSWHDEA